MDEKIHFEIEKIVETFGMKASVVAKAMGITQQTYYSKKDANNHRHQFNAKNLHDLKAFLKREVEKLGVSE